MNLPRFVFITIALVVLVQCASSDRSDKQLVINTPNSEVRYYGITINCVDGSSAFAYPEHPETISLGCSDIISGFSEKEVQQKLEDFIENDCQQILQTEETTDGKMEYSFPDDLRISTKEIDIRNIKSIGRCVLGKRTVSTRGTWKKVE